MYFICLFWTGWVHFFCFDCYTLSRVVNQKFHWGHMSKKNYLWVLFSFGARCSCSPEMAQKTNYGPSNLQNVQKILGLMPASFHQGWPKTKWPSDQNWCLIYSMYWGFIWKEKMQRNEIEWLKKLKLSKKKSNLFS